MALAKWFAPAGITGIPPPWTKLPPNELAICAGRAAFIDLWFMLSNVRLVPNPSMTRWLLFPSTSYPSLWFVSGTITLFFFMPNSAFYVTLLPPPTLTPILKAAPPLIPVFKLFEVEVLSKLFLDFRVGRIPWGRLYCLIWLLSP